jgi:hypothetical protein
MAPANGGAGRTITGAGCLSATYTRDCAAQEDKSTTATMATNELMLIVFITISFSEPVE